MSLIKIDDVPVPCTNPRHNPPSNIVLDPGVYVHTCPECGRETRFTVAGVRC